MKVKISELTGTALDWAVATAAELPIKLNPGHGLFAGFPDGWEYFTPSQDWAQGGPIIEREGISWHCGNKTNWHAYAYGSATNYNGPTPLIAAMRCYVASKLGDEISIPKELL